MRTVKKTDRKKQIEKRNYIIKLVLVIFISILSIVGFGLALKSYVVLNPGDGEINFGNRNVATEGNMFVRGGLVQVGRETLILRSDGNENTITTSDGQQGIALPEELSFKSFELDGIEVTATGEELNLLDGTSPNTITNNKAVIYSSTGGIKANNLDAKSIELGNIPVTANAGELNLLDGASPNTITNNKAVIYNSSGGITTSNLEYLNPNIAIGNQAGEYTQGTSAVAIGNKAAEFTQGNTGVAIGNQAAGFTQGNSGVAIGNQAAEFTQGDFSVAIGDQAGALSQGDFSVAIGASCAFNKQGVFSVAIGNHAGGVSQGNSGVAIGMYAGGSNQKNDTVAIGNQAGQLIQGQNSVGIGKQAGYDNQGEYSVAIGSQAGSGGQGTNSVAIGNGAGFTDQKNNTIAIGGEAGETSQGTNAIAIGYRSGKSNQHNDSIIFNATGYSLSSQGTSRFYVKPIRSASGTCALRYNPVSGEITYTTIGSGSPGSGTVTSVALSSNDGSVTISGDNPITGAGTIDLSVPSGGGGTCYFAGNGLILNGNDFSVVSGPGISVTENVALTTTGVSSGSYTNANITIDQYGRIISASSGVSGVSGTCYFAGNGLILNGNDFSVVSGPGISVTENVALTTTGVSSGSYTNANITIDQYGRIISASSGVSGVSGTCYFAGNGLILNGNDFSVVSGPGISVTENVALTTTGVSSGSYTNANITIDQYGRIISASSGVSGVSGTCYFAGNGLILNGNDFSVVSGPGISVTENVALTTTGVSSGSYTNANITIDQYGRIISASSGVSGVSGTCYFAGNGLILNGNDFSVVSGPGISVTENVALTTTGVSSGSYTNANITIDQYGRIISASSGVSGVSGTCYFAGNGLILNGNDFSVVSGPGISVTENVALTITGVSSGSYTNANITIDQYGRIISASSGVSGVSGTCVTWATLRDKTGNNGPSNIALGMCAGENQGNGSVAIGSRAGGNLQNIYSVAVGYDSAAHDQGIESVAIGSASGGTSQSDYSIAIGARAALTDQGTGSIALGFQSATTSQGDYSVAIGYQAGYPTQPNNSIVLSAIGSVLNPGVSNSFYVKPIRSSEGTCSLQYNPVTGEITYSTLSNSGTCVTWANLGNKTGSSGPAEIALGYYAADSNQGSNTVAIGNYAGNTSQTTNAVAVGNQAGYSNQGQGAVAIGMTSGQYDQSAWGVAIGSLAGLTNQGTETVALGKDAGKRNQGNYSVAVGSNSGMSSQGADSVAIGRYAGQTSQGADSVAIGNRAGQEFQAPNSIIINATGTSLNNFSGTSNSFYLKPIRPAAGTCSLQYDPTTGEITYSSFTIGGVSGTCVTWATLGDKTGPFGPGNIALGFYSGDINQGNNTVAIGSNSGSVSQSANAIALGNEAGKTSQGTNAIAIGYAAGFTNQHNNSIIINATGTSLNTAIGTSNSFYVKPIRNAAGTSSLQYNPNTGEITYSTTTWANLGDKTGLSGPGEIALGQNAADSNQGLGSIAIGYIAGQTSQGQNSVALGRYAGKTSQSNNATAVGNQAGQTNQGQYSVALGNFAGYDNQGQFGVAVGESAGKMSQGQNSVAIGKFAGQTNQSANSIVINATGSDLSNTTGMSFVVKPIRNAVGTSSLQYNPTTGEITYSALAGTTLSSLSDVYIASPYVGQTLVYSSFGDWELAYTPTSVFDVTANGSTAYRFAGAGFVTSTLRTTDNPAIYLKMGQTYYFRNLSSGHPFQIQTSAGAAYSNGVTDNGATGPTGVVKFEVPMDASLIGQTLKYQCTSHPAMNGAIHIS